MNLKIKKLHHEAIIPTYATDGAGCFDLYAVIDGPDFYDFVSDAHPLSVRTGLSFEIPKGQVLAIYSRSGHGFNHSVRLANCVAQIDSDYRGEVMIKLIRDCPGRLTICTGDRIAQAKLEPAEQVTFTEVDELSETVRGDKGFGSSGK